jgi:hypothetical protein
MKSTIGHDEIEVIDEAANAALPPCGRIRIREQQGPLHGFAF